MRDIDYEKSKIDFVFDMTERSTNQDELSLMLLLNDRLKLLEKIQE